MPTIHPVDSESDPARPEVSRSMETLVDATRRLRAAGYVDDFVASVEGNLICRGCDTSHDPETIEILETVRFEGESNPDDQAILLAIASPDGCLGQYCAAFGPGTPAPDARALRRLTPRWHASGQKSSSKPTSR